MTSFLFASREKLFLAFAREGNDDDDDGDDFFDDEFVVDAKSASFEPTIFFVFFVFFVFFSSPTKTRSRKKSRLRRQRERKRRNVIRKFRVKSQSLGHGRRDSQRRGFDRATWGDARHHGKKTGSGKSTLTKVLVGHPAYEVTAGTAKYKGEDLFEMEPEDRARGIVSSCRFSLPVEVPGVSNTDFLRMMCNERRKHRGEEEMDPLEFYGYLSPKLDKLNMDPSFMTRNVNEGFSGGEKKRNEILQLAVLESEMSILDEIDSGLDVDALRDV